jgi:hypothetical protein
MPFLHENHVSKGTGKEPCNGIRDLGVTQQLCLGGKRTLNEALGQTLQLEVENQQSGIRSHYGKQVTGHCGGAGPLPKKEETVTCLWATLDE